MKKRNIIYFISILLNIYFVFSGIYAIYKKDRVKVVGVENAYYLAKESQFETLNIGRSDIVFLGDSITNRCEWEELFNDYNIKNRGIDGDTTDGVLRRLDTITKGHPKKIFLMIGTNDFLHKKDKKYILNNYKKILNKIRMNSPGTMIYIESVLPNNIIKSNIDIELLNVELKKLNGNKIVYINLFDKFVEHNKLSSKYTYDGIHLNGEGYLIWKQEIEKYIN